MQKTNHVLTSPKEENCGPFLRIPFTGRGPEGSFRSGEPAEGIGGGGTLRVLARPAPARLQDPGAEGWGRHQRAAVWPKRTGGGGGGQEVAPLLKGSARKLGHGPKQAGGELIPPRAPAPAEAGGREWTDPPGGADRELSREGPSSLGPETARDAWCAGARLPPAGPRDPRAGRGCCCCCGRTEVRTRNSFLILHNPAPWNKPLETHSLREYDFRGSPDAWVAASESVRPTDSAKRACATLPASALPGAPSRACAMQSPGRRGFGSWARLREGAGLLPQLAHGGYRNKTRE